VTVRTGGRGMGSYCLMGSEKEFKPYQMQNVETATTENDF